MPVLDLPLDQLRTYQGRNPRPVDYDAYWDAALDEMGAVDPRVELAPAAFRAPGVECFDLWFTGVRGARVHAQYLRPSTPGTHPVVMMFHGYHGSAGDWSNKLAFAASGFCVAALDCRGQSGLSEDTGGVKGPTVTGHFIRGLEDAPENMLMRHIFLDTAQMARIVLDFPEVDATRAGATGRSQGGGLTLACAALEPRIRLVAPVFPFLCDYRRVWEMDLAKGAYEELGYFFRRRDPLHEREEHFFTQLGYVDAQFLAPRIRGEVLFAVGLLDAVCPPSTQFAAYNKITAPKSLLVYPDFGHEDLPWVSDKIFEFLMGLL